ncbi:hepatocyte cell adhesion molecule-like isoform X3 [Pristis pectinata]|uniref:hepatocyte cell adhesion molecule-like isoform X3 n=1 Tax=Pristis pectinata TaxID=685728 RepID=UPI00223D4182|nr:hepatocyte cell adhesion molecule-like isoform X3 [Pristis pectinata]
MSGCTSYTFVILFLFIQLGTSTDEWKARKPSQELFGAIGSSILLPGFSNEEVKKVQHVRWAFHDIRILDYYNASHKNSFTNSYKNRCTFLASNGSLLLKNIRIQDTGLYKVDLDLNANSSRVIKLTVIEQLSKPSISTNSNFVDTDIELDCQVSAGNASSVLWLKDDKVITNGRYQFMENNLKLFITNAKKSDCGIYWCIIENPVSKENSSYSLFIHALPFQRNMLLFLHFAAVFALVILVAAISCWTNTLGHSGTTVTMIVLSCLLLTLIILSMCSMKSYDIEWFNNMLSTKLCRVTLDVVTPVSGIIVICSSAILISEIMKQAGKGCEASGNLQTSIIAAVVVPLVILVAVFATYARFYAKHRQKQRTQTSTSHQQEELDQLRSPEEIPLQPISGGNVTSSNSVDREEPS